MKSLPPRSQFLRLGRRALPASGHRVGPGLDEARRALRDRARVRAAHDGLAALRRSAAAWRSAMRCSSAWARPASPSSAARRCACAPRRSSSIRRWWPPAAAGSSCRPTTPSSRSWSPMRPPRSASRNGWARSMRCRSTSTTTRPPRRCSTAIDFYADCRALLTEDGCMTVNLFGRSSSYERSLEKIVGGVRRRGGLGLQADARGQHRGAGAAQPQPPEARPRLPSAPKPSRLAGACPRRSGCGCSNQLA